MVKMAKTVLSNGEMMTVREAWESGSVVRLSTFRVRLKRGWDVERALVTPADYTKYSGSRANFHEWNGQSKTLREWWDSSDTKVVKYELFCRRVGDGWDIEKALTTAKRTPAWCDEEWKAKKSLREWWESEAAPGVRFATFRSRITKGWEWDDALKTSHGQRNLPAVIERNGQSKTLREWWESDAIEGLKYTTFRSRIDNGWGIEKALTTPLGITIGKRRYIEMDGETKSLREWWESEAVSGLSYGTFRMRIFYGWGLESALNTPTAATIGRSSPRRLHERDGQSKTLREWWDSSDTKVVKYELFCRRVGDGWDIEKALTTAKRAKGARLHERDGQSKTLREWWESDAIEGLEFETFRSRINTGWKWNDALTVPPRKRRGETLHFVRESALGGTLKEH